MIVLDTNVIAELVRGPAADRRVVEWATRLPQQPVTTVINRAEALSGAALLPEGARRRGLTAGLTALLGQLGRTLPMTEAAADRYADVVAQRRRAGRPIGRMDGLIAAICLEAGASLATRDQSDFEGLGLELINPWAPQNS